MDKLVATGAQYSEKAGELIEGLENGIGTTQNE
jgi:hypothetical protein